MIFENYIITLLSNIIESGYEAYLTGRAVAYTILEKPIEEYEIFTSAPLFSIPKFQKEKRTLQKIIIEEYYKKITIYSGDDVHEFLKNYSFSFELLAYDMHHGIIDNFHALEQLERKEISLNPYAIGKRKDSCYLEAVYLMEYLQFSLDKALETKLQQRGILSFKNSKELITRFLCLQAPGQLLKQYPLLYHSLMKSSSDEAFKLMDYIKADLTLRLVCLLKHQEEHAIEQLYNWGFPKEERERISSLLEWLSYPLTEDTMDKFLIQKDTTFLKNWFAIKRAECFLHPKTFQEIHRFDDLEKIALERIQHNF